MAIRNSRRLKICCATTIGVLLLIIIVITTLSFTILKPKQPEIIAHPLGLENIQFGGFPNVAINVTLGLAVTIVNRNYGSFKFQNSTAYVSYHGVAVAEILIEGDLIPARGKINITSYADFMVDKLITSPYLLRDITAGSLNFTSTATMHGKVKVLKFLRLEANAHSFCDISLLILSQNVITICHSKIKL
ncbi:late embryogenesis abundant protein At1g64065-like [Rutidosis leptorrhynchoides]|uniref:late embryogenesis abundant protein At1g64065-like n=1 Tax=Rutidosis leptorrhynchoides TaxID=125765 RepID=UPI003A999F8B